MKTSETFSLSRFGEYFILDLRNCFAKVGLTTLVCGLVPLILLVMVAATNFAVGDPSVWIIENSVKDMVTAVTSIFYLLLIPISCYGLLTDKSAGSTSMMLPVSHTEKYASMVINSMIILPLTFAALYFATDAALWALFPARYEDAVLVDLVRRTGLTLFGSTPTVMTMLSSFFMPWMVSAVGLTGALLFKRGKGAKTFAVSAVSFILLVAVLGSIDIPSLYNKVNMHTVNVIWVVFQTVCAVLCLTYVYFRTKIIQY